MSYAVWGKGFQTWLKYWQSSMQQRLLNCYLYFCFFSSFDKQSLENNI